MWVVVPLAQRKIQATTVWLLLLALVIGLFASWLWAGRVSNAQAQERDDLNLFLDASSAGWAEATDRFFAAPEAAASLILSLNEDVTTVEEQVRILGEVVRSQPAFDAAFISDDQGNFVFVGRAQGNDEYEFRTRRIATEPEREVVLTLADGDLIEGERTPDPTDSYDPRTRPWFLAGVDERDQWTAPYQFASSGALGITYSARDEEAGVVVGIDMALSELSGFLNELRPGDQGMAAVVASDGQGQEVIATSAVGDGSLPVSLEEVDAAFMDAGSVSTAIALLEDPTLADDPSFNANSASLEGITSAGDTPADRPFVRQVSSDGERTMVTRAARSDRDWFLSVQSQDSEFLSDAPVQNAASTFIVGLATAVITLGLGLMLQRYRATLKHEAERDQLTGLLSRRALERRLSRGLRVHPVLMVAILDLDRFKVVNDEHGHLVGDHLLAEIGRRVEAFVRSADADAGRLGGDEFAIISGSDLDWARMTEVFAEPIEIDSEVFNVGCSIGIAHGSEADGDTPESLLRAADRALFAVKRAGGAGFAFAHDSPMMVRSQLSEQQR